MELDTGDGPSDRVDPQTPRSASLPFIGAVEAHMLRGLKELGLNPQEIRASVTRLRSITGDEYALATRRVATDGVSLLVDMAASTENPEWERARDGRGAITEVIERYLKFVTWRGSDRYPIRLTLKACEGADVIIDPCSASLSWSEKKSGLTTSSGPFGPGKDIWRLPTSSE
jgi:hypothetical protein